MYGNVLNNAQIVELRKQKDITIEPFDEKRLRLAHYALSISSVLWPGDINLEGKRRYDLRHDFRNGEDYIFEPNEYAVVEVQQFIKLGEGIVGHFIPSSLLIDQGFSLTAGKIDPEYGGLGGGMQMIRFGLKNLKNDSNVINAEQNVAHVYFMDLRGLNNMKTELSRDEIKFLMERYPRLVRARDGGVDYGDGS